MKLRAMYITVYYYSMSIVSLWDVQLTFNFGLESHGAFPCKSKLSVTGISDIFCRLLKF